MRLALDTIAVRTRYRAVTFLSTRPAFYYGVRKLTGTMDQLCVSPDTELVIEGFPRSANSTTTYGFLDRQARPVKLAHHKHHAAQLLRAVAWRIPAVMLIRRPVDAALSHLAMIEEARLRGGDKLKARLSYENVMRSWLSFYTAMSYHLDKVVIAPFGDVTADLEGMIVAINEKFGTEFSTKPLLHVREKPLGWHATPTDLREMIKQELKEGFERTCRSSARLRTLADQANDLHGSILQSHERRS